MHTKSDLELINSPEAVSVATRIQSFFRGRKTRNLYGLTPLASTKQLSFHTLIVGNDPIINGLDKYKLLDAPIALIGTSGLRSVLLACEVGNRQHIPKLFIIDNSKQVQIFWIKIRKLFEICSNQEELLTNFKTLLNELLSSQNTKPNDDLNFSFVYLLNYISQDPVEFLKNLFLEYSYDYVKAIITGTTFISQSWADRDSFIKIKNLLHFLNIKEVFAYPSNIVTAPIPCCQNCRTQLIDKILSNIAELQPRLTIHTNFINTLPRPTEVYLLENTDLNHVRPILFSRGMDDPQEVLKKEIKRQLLSRFAQANINLDLLNNIVESQDLKSIPDLPSIPRDLQITIYDMYHTTLKKYSEAHLFEVENEETYTLNYQ